jgi:hypothetical protein
MSESALPEDLSQWPDNPHELLGVRPGCTAKDLKRNYTRLIRQFKPEHHPEHFRRIRDAYEHLQRYLEIFSHYEVVNESSSELEPERAEDQSRESDETKRDTNVADRSASFPIPQEDPDSLWKRAIQGDDEGAYRGLLQLHHRQPAKTAIRLRLYWLLLLNPGLDTSREAADWLVSGMAETRLTGPLAELYHQFVRWFPREAFSERFEGVLKIEAAPNRLAEVLSWRWQEAFQLDRWGTVGDDMALYRSRIQPYDEDGWVQLLMQVIDAAAWSDNGQAAGLYKAASEEMQEHGHLSIRNPHWFDRCEMLKNIAPGWHKAHSSPQILKIRPFLQLIRKSWNKPFAEVESDMRSVLEAIHDDHDAWLDLFDEMDTICPAMIAHFGNLLQNYEHRAEAYVPTPTDAPQFFGFIEEMIDSFGTGRQVQVRRKLMKLCMREWIPLEWLEPLLVVWLERQNHPGFELRAALAAKVMNDHPLRYICWAERLFWA